jgi:hypothetical protein
MRIHWQMVARSLGLLSVFAAAAPPNVALAQDATANTAESPEL